MTRPSRASRAGQVYLDLRRIAAAEHRPTQEYLELYALEGFLARLALSEYATKLVLKGGMLLAALGIRRPTRDIDVQADDLASDADVILLMAREIASIRIDDGLEFGVGSAMAEIIREQDEYSGVRVTMDLTLARATLKLHLDVNVGDAIWPAPEIVHLPRLLAASSISLRGYPLPMVLAEKIVTAIQRGSANTRWRDFGDIWTLARHHAVKAGQLHRACIEVAESRHTPLWPISEVLDGYAVIAQPKWSAWRRRRAMTSLPDDFAQVLSGVIDIADPVIKRDVPDSSEWRCDTRRGSRRRALSHALSRQHAGRSGPVRDPAALRVRLVRT